MKRRVLGALLGFAAAASAAPVAPFEARYDVSRNGKLAGEARVALLDLGGGRWEWTTRTRGTRGIAALASVEVDERTVFRWNGDCPELIESSYDQRAAWTSRKRSLRVDPSSNTIASFDGKRLHTLAFAPCTIDVHLTIVALMTALARGDEAPAFRVATRDEIEPHAYARSPAAPVEIAAGVTRAVRAERIREDSRRRSAFWFAPADAWLPVRVEYSDAKGERIEMRLAQSSRRAR